MPNFPVNMKTSVSVPFSPREPKPLDGWRECIVHRYSGGIQRVLHHEMDRRTIGSMMAKVAAQLSKMDPPATSLYVVLPAEGVQNEFQHDIPVEGVKNKDPPLCMKFMFTEFKPEELKLTLAGGRVRVEGSLERTDENGSVYKQYAMHEVPVSGKLDPSTIKKRLYPDGLLEIKGLLKQEDAGQPEAIPEIVHVLKWKC